MKKPKLLCFLLLLFLGAVTFSLPMIRSGLVYDFGMGFWGPNGHDGVWHLALIEQAGQKIPPFNPILSGQVITNYHWGFNALAALLNKIIPLPLVNLYFQIIPLSLAIGIGFLSFVLAKTVTKSFWVGFWFVFFNYFCGSFGWLVTLLREGKIGGESLFWSMQSISTLINPPYALSLLVLLLGLWLWQKKRNQKGLFWPLLIGVIFGLATFIKVYAGVVIGLGLFFFWLLKSRKIKSFDFLILVSTGLISLLSLWAIGALSGSSLLIFEPFWFVHSLVESLDKLYLPRLAVLRINLAWQWRSIKLPFLIALEFFLLLIFTLGNLGIRVFSFVEIFRKTKNKKLTDFDWLLLFCLKISFLFPLLFIQSGTSWNTIQFFYYFLFFMNFYLAIFMERLFKKNVLLAAILIILAIPTTISTLRGYWGYPPPAAIPNQELIALDFLKRQPQGNVLTFPYDKYQKQGKETPLALYLYETNAYVAAFSKKPTFLEDEMNLEIMGCDWQKRREDSEKFFSSDDQIWARGFLLNNQIDYLYLVDQQNFLLSERDLGLKMIFEEGQVRIYQVLR